MRPAPLALTQRLFTSPVRDERCARSASAGPGGAKRPRHAAGVPIAQQGVRTVLETVHWIVSGPNGRSPGCSGAARLCRAWVVVGGGMGVVGWRPFCDCTQLIDNRDILEKYRNKVEDRIIKKRLGGAKSCQKLFKTSVFLSFNLVRTA